MKKVVLIILSIFIFLFVLKSILVMKTASFHDFDEANRAEAARNMKIYHSYLTPLTGSPFKWGNSIQIQAKKNKLLNLTYHLERPPLVFLAMIVSTSLFNDSEFFYRLPSLIFGLLTIILVIFLEGNLIVLLSFLTSYDWWLSSQSALMDTTFSFFMFLAFVLILKFLEKKNHKLLFFSGLSFGAGVLSKGQPGIIFVFPLIFLLFAKKINLKELLIVAISAGLIILPWLLFTIYKFGIFNFLTSFLGFAKTKFLMEDLSQKAPFYWYARWWLETFRVGWILFITLIIYDFLKRNFNFKKTLILFYFLSYFIVFSFSKNKVWWYVLPLIPICCLYISESIKNILKRDKNKLINFFLIIFLTSIPVFYKTSNKVSVLYGLFLITLSFFILNHRFKIKKIFADIFSLTSVLFCLLTFFLNFPAISPNYPEAKTIGKYYQKLPQPKCLYVEGVPYEAILFYTQAEEINYFSSDIFLKKKCNNYLVTQKDKKFSLITTSNRLKLYKIN